MIGVTNRGGGLGAAKAPSGVKGQKKKKKVQHIKFIKIHVNTHSTIIDHTLCKLPVTVYKQEP